MTDAAQIGAFLGRLGPTMLAGAGVLDARGPRTRRPAGSTAAGWALSASWHVLALVLLAIAIRPFELPDQSAPVEVQLLPPLVPPPAPIPKPQPQKTPAPTPRTQAAPLPPSPKPIRALVQPAPVAVKPPLTQPLDQLRPEIAPITPPAPPAPPLARPVEVPRPLPPVTARPVQAPPLQLHAPPDVARPELAGPPAPPLALPVQVPAQAPAAKPVQAQAAVKVAPLTQTAPTPVLTTNQVVPGTVEIRPPDRAAQAVQAGAGAPPAGGAGSGGAEAAAGGGGGAAAAAARSAFDGLINGYDKSGGMSLRLGCLNQEVYHLSPADQAACLRRVAEQERAAGFINGVPPEKQAEYDRQTACRSANRGGGVPNEDDNTGLGTLQSLRDCPPGDR